MLLWLHLSFAEIVEELAHQQPVETNPVAAQFEEDYFKQPVNEVPEAQQNVMTNGIEQAPEEPAMDERQDTPSPVVQEAEPEAVSPAESPLPEAEVSIFVTRLRCSHSGITCIANKRF